MSVFLQTVPYATTADQRSESYIKGRSEARPYSKSDSRDCGRNVNVVKGLCTRWDSSLLLRQLPFKLPLTGCTMFEQRLPDLLHAEEGTEGRGRCECYTRAVRWRFVVVGVIISC